MEFITLSDLALTVGSITYVSIVILLTRFLYRRKYITKFVARKIVHLLCGLSVLTIPFYEWGYWPVFIACGSVLVTYISRGDSPIQELRGLYNLIGEKQEEKVGYLEGPFHYSLAIASLVLIFTIIAPERMYIAIAGILIMIVADTLAALVGKKYGRGNISPAYTNSKRTLIGSSTFFIVAFILSCISYSVFGSLLNTDLTTLSFLSILFYSLATASIATMVELFSPSTYDDLTIPLATSSLIYLVIFTV